MTQPRWTYAFGDRLPEGADAVMLLGGKGASLRALTEAGFHVPPAFTITTDCCRAYFDAGRRRPDGLDAQVSDHLARLEQQTQRRYGRAPTPLLLSVRSGAPRSMPGMMDTILNCGLSLGLIDALDAPAPLLRDYADFIRRFGAIVFDWRTPDDPPPDAAVTRGDINALLDRFQRDTGQPFPEDPQRQLHLAVNAVFDSWMNPRAVAYRRRHGIRGLPGTAVNVQTMFPSELSGIVFTRDPNAPDAPHMIIEATRGLGEAIVSGDVTPDHFRVSRDDPSDAALVGDDRPTPCITLEQVTELASLALRVEDHFGHPVDIEWGWADGRFALLQTRRIRGLDVAQRVEPLRIAEIDRLRALTNGKPRVWVEHNLAETLPHPTPLTWDITRRFMRGSGGFGRLYRSLGYRPSRRVDEEGFLELIAGRIYADPVRQAQLSWDGMPLTYDVATLRDDPHLLDQAPTTLDPDRVDERFLLQLPRNLWSMFRSAARMRRARRHAKQHFHDTALPPFLDYVERKRNQSLDGQPIDPLLAELESRCAAVFDDFGAESLRPGFFGGLALASLRGLLAQLLGEQQADQLASTLTLALEGDATVEQNRLLAQVARGEASLEAFLDRYGHRCTGEMELATPRWRDDPDSLQPMLDVLRRSHAVSAQQLHERNLARRDEAEAALPDLLAAHGGSSFREQIEADLAVARQLLPYRETGKHYLMMGYELVRQCIEAIARACDFGDAIYFLQWDELQRLPGDAKPLREAAASRRIDWQAMQRLSAAAVIDSQSLDDLGRAADVATGQTLQGTTISPGAAAGTARIVFDPNQAEALGERYILVCPSTDPGWTPLFMQAAGLIVERGGVLSHGAIVARDFGIPAVVLPDATRTIPDGAAIHLDGDRGNVSLTEEPAADA